MGDSDKLNYYAPAAWLGYRVGQGLGWFGFWIMLGLMNFQQCTDHNVVQDTKVTTEEMLEK